MITVKVDAKQATVALGRLAGKLPTVIAHALNRTAEDANQAIRQALSAKFTIRDRYIARMVAPIKVPSALRAKANNLRVVMETEGHGRLLDPYQVGEPKTTDRLGRLVPVPSTGAGGLRPTKGAVIPRTLFPHNLGLQVRRDPKGTTYYALGKNAIKRKLTPFRGKSKRGKRGTFEITGPRGTQLIYQRLGPGKRNIRLLWELRPVVRRPAILGFYETGIATFNARWPVNFDGVWRDSLKWKG